VLRSGISSSAQKTSRLKTCHPRLQSFTRPFGSCNSSTGLQKANQPNLTQPSSIAAKLVVLASLTSSQPKRIAIEEANLTVVCSLWRCMMGQSRSKRKSKMPGQRTTGQVSPLTILHKRSHLVKTGQFWQMPQDVMPAFHAIADTAQVASLTPSDGKRYLSMNLLALMDAAFDNLRRMEPAEEEQRLPGHSRMVSRSPGSVHVS
jgi:hypothetical protein